MASTSGRRSPDRALKVFISSRMEELARERAAIDEVLAQLRLEGWLFEVHAGARPDTVRETYLDEIDDSDLYVLVLWRGYGEYTLDEFEYAQSRGTPTLVYEKQVGISGRRDPRLTDFRGRFTVNSGPAVKWFRTDAELRQSVQEDVARLLARAFRGNRSRVFQAPSIPDRFVERTEAIEQLRDLVLPSDPRAVPGTSRTVVHGGPGSGKSMLAKRFANDPDV